MDYESLAKVKPDNVSPSWGSSGNHVKIVVDNLTGPREFHMRHYPPGFFISVTAEDDLAFYLDAPTVPKEVFDSVVDYFEGKLAGIGNPYEIAEEIAPLFGDIETSIDFS